jgi:Methyltransferase domain
MPLPFNKLLSPRFLAGKVVRVMHNTYWDWRFGGSCGGRKISPFAYRGINGTQSTDYLQLELLFKAERVPIGDADVLVDVGCGKGRVINFWLRCGHRNPMIGIEIDPEIANLARQRLRRYPNVTILTGDVVDNLPPGATKFYLWNPFGSQAMRRFKARLLETYGQRGNVTLIYYHCVEISVFENDPNWIIQRLDAEPSLAFPSAIITMTATAPPLRQAPCSASLVNRA